MMMGQWGCSALWTGIDLQGDAQAAGPGSFAGKGVKVMDFEEEVRRRREDVNQILKKYLPKEEGFQKTLLEAMNYSMLAGGKRLRPLMMKCSYEMYGGEGQVIEPFMAAMEMIHTHSLIHDDLPAMDNDEYRRGMKTTHIIFGEAMAILAGDALLNHGYETAVRAFSMISMSDDAAMANVASALGILSRKTGIEGMIGGQSLDVEYDGQALTEGQVDYIYSRKTGALIEASLMIGAALAGAPEGDIKLLETVGADVGTAFQIRDDVLDVTGTVEELGKNVKSDERNQKTTYVTLHGIEASNRQVELLSRRAIESFDKLHGKHAFLRKLLLELIVRNR